MFTGIIHGQGEVAATSGSSGQARFRIRPLFVWNGPEIGESVAVNGACLTVETWDASGPFFSVYASMESIRRTNLADLRPGRRVNLERALAVGDRLGGHLVSGHVDAVARVESARPEGDSRRFRLSFAGERSREIVDKASVALDGISLTVNGCGPGWLEVNVIPETWRVTTVAEWRPGRRVNMETDLLGKYARRALAPRAAPDAPPGEGGLTLDFLREHGF